ncbi:ECF RNA polymerase sigma factor SigE [subsurface metagenome]
MFLRGTNRKDKGIEKAKMLSDTDIINRYIKLGDAEVLAPLFNRYIHLVFGVCLKYLKNKEDAKDAAMEIMESLMDKLLQHEISNFPSWLHTVSRNYCLMRIRSRKEDLFIEFDKRKSEQIPVESDEDLHQRIEEEAQLNEMGKAIVSLNPEQKQCIQLFFFEKRSYDEIAKETGYSVNKVKSHIQNGKRNLRIYLMENEKG